MVGFDFFPQGIEHYDLHVLFLPFSIKAEVCVVEGLVLIFGVVCKHVVH